MKTTSLILVIALWSMSATSVRAQAGAAAPVPQALQDHEIVRKLADQYLVQQAAGLSGDVQVVVNPIEAHVALARCMNPEPFLPPGSRAWGKTTVGVKCAAPSVWTIYLSATVKVYSNYAVTTRPILQGQTLGPGDFAMIKGDLTNLPPGIVTDANLAIGASLVRSLMVGMPIRQDSLRSPQVVQQGQTVRLVSTGAGFQVSQEAHALNSALEGQSVQTKTSSGQLVSGIARAGGTVEVLH